MKTPFAHPDPDRAACDWIARRDRGLSATETKTLERWLTKPRHAEAFARCEAAWEAFHSLGTGQSAARIGHLLRPRYHSRVVPILGFGGATLVAAAAMLLAYVGHSAKPLPGFPSPVSRFSAPVDSERRVSLPDGSVAVLHRGSRIVFGAFADSRQVRLLEGEAHFTVTKSTATPFLVRAGAVKIRDIGTAFNVRLDPERVEVLVTEGAIEVVASETHVREPTAHILTTGQQATLATLGPPADGRSVEVRVPAAPEIAEVMAWKSKRLSFDRTPLSEAVAELNRYNVRQLVLAEMALAGTPIAGSVQSDNLDAFVRLLDTGFNIGAEEQRGVILLRSR
ncbi:MAG: FecR domain-containing protein [Opitutaceae bacterium]|nr:FecR domain-containing protein [Opitutaceae bacterium]